MNIFIEVNNYCELKCRFCIADLGYKYPSTNISTELIDEIINTYQNDKHKAVFITGGEPLLHPKIADIIRNFAINGYYTSQQTDKNSVMKNLLLISCIVVFTVYPFQFMAAVILCMIL